MGIVETLGDRFRTAVSPDLLRSCAFWLSVSGVARTPVGRPRSPADAAALRQAIESTRDAFLGRKPVAWANLLFPSELMHGAGVLGFYPEIAAAAITTAGLSEKFLQRASADGFSTDLCSFHRVVLGAAGEGFLPRPDVMLSNSCPCDSAPMSFAYLADSFGVEQFAIDVPSCVQQDLDTIILAAELEEAFSRLKHLGGGTLDGGCGPLSSC